MQPEKKSVRQIKTAARFSGVLFCTVLGACGSTQDQTGQFFDASDARRDGVTLAAHLQLQSALLGTREGSEVREPRAAFYATTAESPAARPAMIHTALDLKSAGQGKPTNALPELDLGPALDGKSFEAVTAQVMTQLRARQYDEALDSVKKLEKQQPKNPFVQNLKGGVYVALKDNAAARLSFEKALSLSPIYFPAAENLARMDLHANHPELAKERYESLLTADKKNVAAMIGLGNLAVVTGHPAEATTWFEKAVAENPADVSPALVLGAHYLRTGARDKAQTLVQRLMTANPGNAAVMDFYGQGQAANKDLNGSLLTFKKLATENPTSAQAQIRIASVYLAMQNQADAVVALNKALTLQPDNLEAEAALLALHGRAGEFESALKIARQVQKQRPAEPIGLVMEGDVLMAQKKTELALKAYEQAGVNGKSGQLLIKQRAALLALGKENDADALAVQWLKDHPQDTLVQLNLANGYLARKQPKAAIELYDAALRSAPQNPEILNNLALAYHQAKDARDLETAERALKLAPNNPGIMDTLGWILIEKGNDARGLGLLQKAIAILPGNEEIRLHLAVGLTKAGDKAGARKELTTLAASKNGVAADEAKRLLKDL